VSDEREPIVPDVVLSSEEMRRATGLDDLHLLDGLKAANVPDGYARASREDAESVLMITSGQDFLVWCRPFLDALARYGTVRRACQEAGINRRDYRLAIQWQHGFSEAVEDALADYADRLDEQALDVVMPRYTDKETGEEKVGTPFDKAYGLLWKVMQGRMPEKYGAKAQRPTRAMSGDQKRFLIEAIIRSGFSRAEAESMVDLGSAAMALASGER